MAARYTFSGHESFYCKSLWLKKGYDAIESGVDFNSPDAVVNLGVGKNMVSAIRFWVKAYGLWDTKNLTPFASYVFGKDGRDPYLEDAGTLFLLHYFLVKTGVASIYSLAFLEFRREKMEFDREGIQSFIKRKCSVPEQKNVYNENTVRKDIRVMLQTYVAPDSVNSPEDFSALLIDLGLIRRIGEDRYCFSEINPDVLDTRLLLFALLDYKGDDSTVSFDVMQELCLIFGLSVSAFVAKAKEMETLFPGKIAYTDNSGIKNIQFLGNIDKFEVLNEYYV